MTPSRPRGRAWTGIALAVTGIVAMITGVALAALDPDTSGWTIAACLVGGAILDFIGVYLLVVPRRTYSSEEVRRMLGTGGYAAAMSEYAEPGHDDWAHRHRLAGGSSRVDRPGHATRPAPATQPGSSHGTASPAQPSATSGPPIFFFDPADQAGGHAASGGQGGHTGGGAEPGSSGGYGGGSNCSSASHSSCGSSSSCGGGGGCGGGS